MLVSNGKGDKMKVIGITGGVGCGKSFIMEQLQERYQAGIILTDLVAHDLMEPGGVSYQEIVVCFGTKILEPDGKINRQALGSIVFQDKEALLKLNSITHPNVKKEVIRRIEEMKRAKEVSIIMVEAALLIEEHYDEICDELWFIDASDEVRIKRLMEKRGYTKEKCLSIMSNQLQRERFLEHCGRVIYNDKTKEDAVAQLDAIMKEVI